MAQTIKAFIPLLKQGQQKKVLVVTSAMGSPAFALEAANTYAVSYATSKAALNMITAKYALAYKDEGIVFLAVSPGLVKTMQGGEVLTVGVSTKFMRLTNLEIPRSSTRRMRES